MTAYLYLLMAETYNVGLFRTDQAAKDYVESVQADEWEDCGEGNWVAMDYWEIERVKVHD
jgi:hypothetical protein